MSNPHPRNPPAWLAKAQIMRAEKASIRSIAKTLRAGHQAVRTWLERFPPGTALPVPIEKPQAEWEDHARQMRANGDAWKTVSLAIGVKEHTVRMAIDPVFRARTLAKQEAQRELRKHTHPERRACASVAERPRASAEMLAAGRFYRIEDRRHGR